MLRTQIPFPFDIDRFLDRAIREFPEDPAAFAYTLIVNSKAFARRFPGIKRSDGTLRVSPAEYIAREEQFASTAAQFGFSLSRSQVGGLISQNVDPQEFTVRARGVQLAQTNPGLVDFLNQQISTINKRRLKTGGKRIPMIRSAKDVVDFFSGRADRTVYAVYEGALFQQAAKDSGIDITKGQAQTIAKRTAGVLDLEQIEDGFANIASQVRFAGVELDAIGITPRELEILEFGGPGRNAIREKVERELRNRQADLATDRVGSALSLDELGRPTIPGASL